MTQEMPQAVMRLRGLVTFVALGSLPTDGKLPDEHRTRSALPHDFAVDPRNHNFAIISPARRRN